MFWKDKVIMTLFVVGIVISFTLFLWVAVLQTSIPNGTIIDQGEQSVTLTANQLFLYPGLGLLLFVGAIYGARLVYSNNQNIAYRIIVASHFFQLFWFVLVYWTIDYF